MTLTSWVALAVNSKTPPTLYEIAGVPVYGIEVSTEVSKMVNNTGADITMTGENLEKRCPALITLQQFYPWISRVPLKSE
ncbi:hypothetical protein DPMN_034256 [Dreissena polymorpha]|uniref:Uncharacterized protein n=1 Tax=Dreissena polymorpha TaxID=45954 RepID=A0A9D4M8N0_DREPO|nr:hypothetical protein DPMN_034256 [Dreissena polymorpha]